MLITKNGSPNYQWRFRPPNGNWTPIEGEVGTNLLLENVQLSQLGDYDVEINPTYFECQKGFSGIATINVYNPPTVVTANDFSICSTAAEIPLSAEADNYSSLEWTVISGSGSFTDATVLNATYVPGAAESGDVVLQLQANGYGTCGSVTDQITINIIPIPEITIHPLATVLTCESDDDPIVLSINATGPIAEYRWRKNGVPLSDGGNISGATTAELTISNQTPDDSGSYDVVISSPAETCSQIISTPSAVSVNPAPVIDSIGADIEICSVGEEVNITTGVAVSNESSIEWSVPAGQGTISNATQLTGATYTPNGASGNITLILKVQGLDGCSEISSTKTITIIPQPVITEFSYITGNNTAVSGEFCETDNTTYMPHINGDNLGNNGNGNFTVDKNDFTLNASNGSFSPEGKVPGDYIITYTFTANSSSGVCQVASRNFTVTIGEKPIADFSYENTTFCNDSGNPLPIMATNAVKGTFSSTLSGLVFASTSTGEIDIAGSTPGTYTITNTIAPAEGCAEVKATTEIKINAKPSAPQIANLVYCLNEENAAGFFATPVNGGSINWYATVDATTAMGAAPVINTGEAKVTSYWTSQTSAEGCESERAAITVTINELPEVTITTEENPEGENVSICQGTAINLVGNGATTYSWRAGSLESAILGEESTLNVIPTETTTYFVVGKNNFECEDISQITIEVDEPTLGGVASEDANVCYGTNSGLLNLTSHRGNVIRWESSIDDWETIIKFPENNSTSFAYNNLTETTKFRAVVQNGVCGEKFSEEATITVDALSVGGTITFGNSSDTNILLCHMANDDSVVAMNLSGITGEVVRWEYRTHSSTQWTEAPNSDGKTTYSDYSGIDITRIYRAIIKNGSCNEASSEIAIVSIIPNIAPSVDQDKTVVCLGKSVRLEATSNFTWQANMIRDGGFPSANPKNGWNADGCENCLNTGGSSTSPTSFVLTQSTPNNRTFSNVDYYGGPGNRFAIVHGITDDSYLETPIFNTLGLATTFLTFNHAYRLLEGASARVELSLDEGATYTIVLAEYSGTLSPFASSFPEERINLSEYFGMTGLRLRFYYVGKGGSSWAIDNIAVPDAPIEEEIAWVDPNTGVVISNNQNETFTPTHLGWNRYAVVSMINGCISTGEGGTTYVDVYAYDSFIAEINISPEQNIDEEGNLQCGNTSINLEGKIFSQYQKDQGEVGEISTLPHPGVSNGKWTVDGLSDEASRQLLGDDLTKRNIIFNAPAGTYTINWTITPANISAAEGEPAIPLNNCEPFVDSFTVTIKGCENLIFDGVDDLVDLGDVNVKNSFSYEAWIKAEKLNGTILSGPGFELSLDEGKPRFNSVISSHSIDTVRWYHIAASSSGNLYIDGIKVATGTISSSGVGKSFIGAKVADSASNHFKGWIEEVRFWDKSLKVEQIRFMMNQRLQDNVHLGVEIPMPLNDLSFNNLAGYYQLIVANINPVDGTTPNEADNSKPGRLINMTHDQENTAPLPYTSFENGSWCNNQGTWTHHTVWDPPYSKGIKDSLITWNIVRTSHNILSGMKDIKVLGLISETGILDMEGYNPTSWINGTGGTGNELFISHYLKLNGIINLNGESQLLQPEGSIVDDASMGILYRDQQGTANSFNYNYWSSPVSPGTKNAAYQVKLVMKDGTNFNSDGTPKDIEFEDSYAFADGGLSNPRKISNYWINTFNGNADDYGSWNFRHGSEKDIQVGEGYTMKGTSGGVGLAAAQNYTFAGIPNNGTIRLVSSPERNYLIGNPYPSALDAREFIKDNIKSIKDSTGTTVGRGDYDLFDGNLYFWDHFGEKNSHYLEDYVGGYASLNLTGGVGGISNDNRIDSTDQKSNRKPGYYIPVGQSFFINSANKGNGNYSIISGVIQFKNSQRGYEKEGTESIFLRPEVHTKRPKNENIEKIRISYRSPLGYNRQILVGATPAASNDFDLGYDAPIFDYQEEDMYWLQGNNWLVIQGVGHFNEDQVLPLGVVLKEEGKFTIQIDSLENFAELPNVYINVSTPQSAYC
ncbi:MULTISPECIES: LamG-like jellyroll fold domain-containing protein [Antarcticibacterium]|nr:MULTISPECIES: LamG-like jellyroll fold domain-containing protein [Antarcticibacterium]